MKNICIITLLLLLAPGSMFVCGQEKKSKKQQNREHADEIRAMVEGRDYRFVAQRALPMTGGTMDLTGGYGLSVSKDSVAAYLPYFGRSYIAPIDNTQTGIQFESKEFEYKTEEVEKGGWDIYITPRDDGRKRYELILRVAESGYASLAVNDDTRQSITFNGYIEKRSKSK